MAVKEQNEMTWLVVLLSHFRHIDHISPPPLFFVTYLTRMIVCVCMSNFVMGDWQLLNLGTCLRILEPSAGLSAQRRVELIWCSWPFFGNTKAVQWGPTMTFTTCM
jgi:hypothetical protein